MCKHCWNDSETTHHKDFIRGGVNAEDFEEVPYRHPKRRKPKREKYPRQSVPGCVGNDNGPHIYVWTAESIPTNYLFYKFYGWHSVEWKVCCGCGKRAGERKSERYEKVKRRKWINMYGNGDKQPRGTPVPRRWRGPSFAYWSWESYDEAFVAYRKDYIQRHGWAAEALAPCYWI